MGRSICPYLSDTRILGAFFFLVPRHDPWRCISAHIGLVNSCLLSIMPVTTGYNIWSPKWPDSWYPSTCGDPGIRLC